MKKVKYIVLFLVSIIFLTACNSLEKGDFPYKNIRIIVPYGAGGGVDITTRIFTESGKDHEDLNGKSFVVENISGGGGAVGHTVAYKEKADGYTVIAYTNALVNNPVLKDVVYNVEDFKTLAMVCFDPEILVVPSDSEFNTLEEFLEYSKENRVKVSTPGHSTSHHMAASILSKEEGLNFKYLYNDGASIQMQQLMGSHCDAAFMSVGETVDQIKDGSIKALGIMNDKRIENIPNVPTFKEKGIELFLGAYRGYGCSKDVSNEEYEKLKRIFQDIGSSKEFKDALEKAGIPYCYKDADEFQEYIDGALKDVEEVKSIMREKN